MTQLRVGLSGCGRRGNEVIEAIRRHDHCDVIALHDVDPGATLRLGKAFGIQQQTNHFSQLLETGIDFVVLAGPCGDRLPQVLEAADQGVHCLLHAPMAPDAECAAQMVEACDNARVKLGVTVREQAFPAIEQIRQMVASDWLGAPVAVTALYGEDDALRTPPPAGHWRRDARRNGDHAMLQLATEHIHLTSWLIGRGPLRATSLSSSGFSVMPQDNASATLELRGGLLCSFSASHLTNSNALAIHGTDGAIRMAPDRVHLRGRREWRGEVFDYLEPEAEMTLQRQPSPATEEQMERFELHGRFARWIDDRDDFPCPGDQAALDMRICDAFARAQTSGQTESI
ncbi:MAG: Gfo/Idh/MocA family oxidoreductase [Planctomycetota bacterium]|nr:Gfo/Idh/MocA family oxidoreductase [Planctomycetota bacterium]